jgi:hypothetical protein
MYFTTQQACWCIEYAVINKHDQNGGGLWGTKYATLLGHGSILKLSILVFNFTFIHYSNLQILLSQKKNSMA